jgi:hypothetical protein
MEKSAAITIQNQLEAWSQHTLSSYTLDKLELSSSHTLKNFQQ